MPSTRSWIAVWAAIPVLTCARTPQKLQVVPDRVVLSSKTASERLTVRATDSSGNAIEGVAVTWKSMDDAVCLVDAVGIVTGKRSGECRVRAFVGDLRADAMVRVAIVGSVEVEPTSIVMGTGSTRRFSAKVLDDRGQPILGVGGITWGTSDPAIATVDKQGNVTTIEEGEVRIVARTGELEGAAMLVVKTGTWEE